MKSDMRVYGAVALVLSAILGLGACGCEGLGMVAEVVPEAPGWALEVEGAKHGEQGTCTCLFGQSNWLPDLEVDRLTVTESISLDEAPGAGLQALFRGVAGEELGRMGRGE